MKRLWIGWGIIMLATLAFGTDKAKAPVIPDTLLAKYWKSQVQLKAAREVMAAADASANEAVKEIQAVCGEEFQPQMDSKGDPVCALKPAKDVQGEKK